MDSNNIKPNSSYRSICKLICNALFGKLCQAERKQQTAILKDPSELQYFVNSPLYEITDIYFPNENFVFLTWKNKETSDKVKIDTE